MPNWTPFEGYTPQMLDLVDETLRKQTGQGLSKGHGYISSNTGYRPTQSLAPEELYRNTLQMLAQDQARTGKLGYPVYKGQTLPPMSTLTQKARENRELINSKAAPYSKKISTVLNRGNEGFSPEQQQSLLAMLTQGQKGAQGTLSGVLEKNLRGKYNPERIGRREEKVINKGLPEFESNIRNLGSSVGNLQGKQNQNLVNLLQQLQGVKQARSEGVIGMQQQFGNQKHTHGNYVNQANKEAFEQEAQAPFMKQQRLAQSLQATGNNLQEGTHPDLARSNANTLGQAVNAYQTPYTSYPGKRVADLTPEMLSSYNLAERMSPKIKDEYSQGRKEIVNNLMGNEGLGGKALQNLPEAVRGQIEQLDSQAKKQLKDDIKKIGHEFTRHGQFGSPAYIREVEKRKKDIDKSIFEQRQKLLTQGLGNQVTSQYGNEQGQMGKALGMGAQGQKDFLDVLKKQYDLNKLGSTKWENEQDELSRIYKNYQNEGLWEWPHLRQAIGQQGQNQGFTTGFNQGLPAGESIGKLALEELQKKYDAYYKEKELELGGYKTNILALEGYKTAAEEEKLRLIEENARIARAAQTEKDRLAAIERAKAQQVPVNNTSYNSQQQSSDPYAGMPEHIRALMQPPKVPWNPMPGHMWDSDRYYPITDNMWGLDMSKTHITPRPKAGGQAYPPGYYH